MKTEPSKIHIVFKGLIIGAFYGLFLTGFVFKITESFAINELEQSEPALYERASLRHAQFCILITVPVSAIIGAIIFFIKYEWIKPVVMGMLWAMIIVSIVHFTIAFVNDYYPFSSSRLILDEPIIPISYRGLHNVTWHFGIPAAFLFGPIINICISRYRSGRANVNYED